MPFQQLHLLTAADSYFDVFADSSCMLTDCFDSSFMKFVVLTSFHPIVSADSIILMTYKSMTYKHMTYIVMTYKVMTYKVMT